MILANKEEAQDQTFKTLLSAANDKPSREEVLRDYLRQIYRQKTGEALDKDRSSLIKESCLGKVVISNILLAKKGVCRKTLLAIAFALKLNKDETKELLEKGGYSALSLSVKYDAVLSACIDAASRDQSQWTIQKVNGILQACGFTGSRYLLGMRSQMGVI